MLPQFFTAPVWTRPQYYVWDGKRSLMLVSPKNCMPKRGKKHLSELPQLQAFGVLFMG